MLTLPICAWIKESFPSSKLIFLCRNYTLPIVECFPMVDEIHSYDELELLPVQGRVEAIRAWKAANPDATERPSIEFPITIKFADGSTQEISSKEGLFEAKELCE